MESQIYKILFQEQIKKIVTLFFSLKISILSYLNSSYSYSSFSIHHHWCH